MARRLNGPKNVPSDIRLKTDPAKARSKDALANKRFRFSQRTAERFMAIAKDKRLTKTTHGSFLLWTHWRPVYEISRLPDETLEAAFVANTIRPDMERHDVPKRPRLLTSHKPKPVLKPEEDELPLIADDPKPVAAQAEAPAEPEPAPAQKQPGAEPTRIAASDGAAEPPARKKIVIEFHKDRHAYDLDLALNDCTASGGFSGGLAPNWPRVYQRIACNLPREMPLSDDGLPRHKR